MTPAHGDVLPARQTRALVAAGYRDWPSPRVCPAYGMVFPSLLDAIEADGEQHSWLSYIRFLIACWRCRRAVRRDQRR